MSVEDRFIQKFKSEQSDTFAQFIFLMILMVGTYAFLFLHYTEDYWKANEIINELPTSLMVLCRTFLAIIMHILLDVDIR